MAVLDWLQQLLGGGDPEAQGAAAASTAMMPAVNQWAQNVASGQYVRQGLPSNYDPQRSFAQNALDPGSLENALNVALGVGGGSGLGIKAYHGSPADFSAEPGYPLGRFRDDKIGTGEGAQAYAYGHYGAEAEPVARGYRDQISLGQVRIPGSEANLAEHDVLGQAARHLYNANGDYDLAAQRIRQLVPDAKQPQTLQSLGELQKLGAAPHAGKMYEVDINAEPEHFLDWDKPATAQPPNVQDALGKIWQQLGGTTEGRQYPPFAAHSETTGEGLHAALATTLGSKEAAAAALRDAGVPGVRYLDANSRRFPAMYQADLAKTKADVADLSGALKTTQDALQSVEPGSRAHNSLSLHALDYSSNLETAQARLDRLLQNPVEATSNYVVFDPKIIEIRRKYGLAGLTAGGGLLGAADQQ